MKETNVTNDNLKLGNYYQILQDYMDSKTNNDFQFDSLPEMLKTIVHNQSISFSLMHFIPTENVITEKLDVSAELNQFMLKSSQEFVNMVIEPLSKSILDYIKKYPEFKISKLNVEDSVANGLSLGLKHMVEKIKDE